MKTMEERLAVLPKVIQNYIQGLENENRSIRNELKEYLDNQTESRFFVEKIGTNLEFNKNFIQTPEIKVINKNNKYAFGFDYHNRLFLRNENRAIIIKPLVTNVIEIIPDE